MFFKLEDFFVFYFILNKQPDKSVNTAHFLVAESFFVLKYDELLCG